MREGAGARKENATLSYISKTIGDNNLIIIIFFLTTGEQIFGIKCVNVTYNTAQWTGTSEGFISITA